MSAYRPRIAAAAILFPALAFAAPTTPPETTMKPVTDEYHGITVVDQYRWLEDWDNPVVKDWSAMQNAYTRAYLDDIKCVPALRERVTELENAVGPRYLTVHFAAGTYFAAKSVPEAQQPLIVALPSLSSTDGEHVIIDPNKLDKEGGTAFDWFVPSPDGKLIAVSLSSGGSEAGDARIFDVATGKERTQDRVAHVNGGTAGGSLAWAADSKGFYYTRYPRPGERPEEDLDFYTQLYFHKLGEPVDQDSYETGKDYPKIAEIAVEVSHDGHWALTNVQNGDGGEFIQDIRTPDGKWVRLTDWEDRIVEARFGHDDAAYLVSRKNALMGKVLRLPLKKGETPTLANAKEIVPEQADASIETSFSDRTGIYLTDSRLFVLYQVGGPNELRVFDIANGMAKPAGKVDAEPISTIEQVEALNGNAVVYQNDSYIRPPAWFVFKPGDKMSSAGAVEPTALKQAPPPNMPELAVRREMAVSKDGTKVPVNIIARKAFFEAFDKSGGKPAQAGRVNVPAPTIVYGYGGYGVNVSPAFSRRIVLMTEQDGVYVVANIRGGGEYGERWHREGNLTKKQNVFDDFQAACKHMIERGYTTRDKLAIFGGSNGGLLMGTTFTQQPDLCKCVVSAVGIYDMLRVELSANGAFNITEFGTVKDKAQFDALYAYSPYHHIKSGVKYPAILFLTGANDPRVDPMQSRKMTAAIQAAESSVPQSEGGPSPVYLRTSGNTGHGMGTPLDARIEETVDTFAYLFDQLGVDYKSPDAK
ncbi:MAG: S9 family peptidase [Phycisphaerales bacterium]|nr:S9 family peptidase [Phycisphaerales bacterium]MCB9856369.1 S9 family peptidase [Phycisphaerales bacterium]MCB9864041.1 S9 family peptidase [Phycisphaerales bacterium]